MHGTTINGWASAQIDSRRFIHATRPTVHQVMPKLEIDPYLQTTPNVAQSLQLTIDVEAISKLESRDATPSTPRALKV